MASMLRKIAGFTALVAMSAMEEVAAESGEIQSVRFNVQTTKGPQEFIVDVHPDWSPNGAKRFGELVKAGFYDDSRFFRVIPGFMAQFGLSGDPARNNKWDGIQDDPSKAGVSNKRGFVSFAKTGAPNSRTTQLFVNFGDNSRLDSMGFTPFGVIREGGMDAVDSIYAIQERPSQQDLKMKGNSYIDDNFPQASTLTKAEFLQGGGDAAVVQQV